MNFSPIMGIPPGVWAMACIVVGSVLVLFAVRPLPWRRLSTSSPAAVAPAGPGADDFPTAEIPTGLPPVPAPSPRHMLRADELLWHKGAGDAEGVITLGLVPEAAGQLGVLMDVDGEAVGVRLDRLEVQGLRDAITAHLVGTASPRRVQP